MKSINVPWLFGSGSRRASAPDRESSPSLQPSTSQATNFCCGFPKSLLPRGPAPASKSEGLGFCHQVVAPLHRCSSKDTYFKDHLPLDKRISCATTHAETAEWKCNEWIPRSLSMNASCYIEHFCFHRPLSTPCFVWVLTITPRSQRPQERCRPP